MVCLFLHCIFCGIAVTLARTHTRTQALPLAITLSLALTKSNSGGGIICFACLFHSFFRFVFVIAFCLFVSLAFCFALYFFFGGGWIFVFLVVLPCLLLLLVRELFFGLLGEGIRIIAFLLVCFAYCFALLCIVFFGVALEPTHSHLDLH